MNSNRVAEIMYTVGKLLYLAEQGTTASANIEAAMTAVQIQNASASGSADPYNELQVFTSPLLQQSLSITQAIDRIGNLTSAGIGYYLRAIVGELNVAPTAAPANIAAALGIAMQSSGDTVYPSGTIANYFANTFGANLPTNPAPSIPDSIITVTII
jgi:hypothetical protein